MSARHVRLIAAILAALLVLWGASQLLSHGSDSVQGSVPVPHVTAEQADHVTIRHGTDTVDLVRAGTQWMVNSHRASLSALNDLLLALRDSAPPELAATNRSSWTRMGVDSTGGWWLSIRGKGVKLLRLVVGQSGPGYQSGYVRLPGSDSVYLWQGRLPELVRRPVEQWRDHRIAAVTPDSVRAIEVTVGRAQYALARDDSAHWRLRGGAAADSGKVTALLGRLRDLQATGFATDAQADSSARRRPDRRLVLRGAGPAPLVALTFDSTATGYWVRRSGDSVVYRLEPWVVQGLTPEEKTMKP
jgi:Domain of unknown function (DUF4340)